MDRLAPILLAEDDENDIIMFRVAQSMAGVDYPVTVARDGRDAVDYLSGKDPYHNRQLHPLPALIILDIRMPRMNGFDVLKWISQADGLSQIPALVLSSSAHVEDIARANQLGAREYFTKPHSIHDLVKLVKNIHQQYLSFYAAVGDHPMG